MYVGGGSINPQGGLSYSSFSFALLKIKEEADEIEEEGGEEFSRFFVPVLATKEEMRCLKKSSLPT